MMMTPEQYAELRAKAQPLLEKLVEVLNELNALGDGQPVIVGNSQIVTGGGFVQYWRYVDKWEIGEQR